MSFERMKAILLQEYYITKHSVEVIVDLFYFSVIAIVVNGFITVFLAKSIGEILKDMLSMKIKDKKFMRYVCSKLRGHVQYYGVSFNDQRVEKFLYEAKKIIFKWLNRRSQRKSFSWEKFSLYVEAHPLPTAKVIHRLF